MGFLSSPWQSHSKYSSSPPTSLRDIAEVTPKPKHHPKERSLKELLAALPEEALGPGPPGRTLGLGWGHGQALAQLKWRVCTGPLAHWRPGDPEGGGSHRRRRGGGGEKHLSEWESPAQPWGGPSGCSGVRRKVSRQVHGLGPALCIQILLPLLLPQKQ